MSNVIFYVETVEDIAATRAAGEPVTKRVEMVKITQPGDTAYQHVTKASDGIFIPGEGWTTPAEYYAAEYAAFKEKGSSVNSGTPLVQADWLPDARRRELERHHVYTVEALASLDVTQVGKMGPGTAQYITRAHRHIQEQRDAMSLADQNELKAKLAEQALMIEQLQAQANAPRRGRPPKAEGVAA